VTISRHEVVEGPTTVCIVWRDLAGGDQMKTPGHRGGSTGIDRQDFGVRVGAPHKCRNAAAGASLISGGRIAICRSANAFALDASPSARLAVGDGSSLPRALFMTMLSRAHSEARRRVDVYGSDRRH